MSIALLLLAKAVAVPAPVPVPPVDACASMVPPALALKLKQDFPEFTLPQDRSAGEARLQAIADEGDWPCPFVALGDFDGNGTLDRALLLVNPVDARLKLVAAMNADRHWRMALSENWGLSLNESWLHPLEPGLYQRSGAATKPAAELDLLNSIESDVPGFAAGKVKDRYAVYFFQNGSWQHLWMRD